ncbi:hypothetical protein E1292_29495 [Nonomuraea deserti]|uniref:Uncharacterized protein n=1 Tax=Nonomuraea deserti TaxID=1848322 RepID=A0A4R4VCD9_9ACTN|nr:hypothetical protein [Nonomuraea deserti]TDD00163.1 hypothetical protein E1292_29495 [Nonomuraea deserti]
MADFSIDLVQATFIAVAGALASSLRREHLRQGDDLWVDRSLENGGCGCRRTRGCQEPAKALITLFWKPRHWGSCALNPLSFVVSRLGVTSVGVLLRGR